MTVWSEPQGTTFYEELLQRLQTSFKFTLDDFLHTHKAPPENIGRVVKLALVSCQRVMICLGDIARYRELAMQTSNYGRARRWVKVCWRRGWVGLLVHLVILVVTFLVNKVFKFVCNDPVAVLRMVQEWC